MGIEAGPTLSALPVLKEMALSKVVRAIGDNPMDVTLCVHPRVCTCVHVIMRILTWSCSVDFHAEYWARRCEATRQLKSINITCMFTHTPMFTMRFVDMPVSQCSAIHLPLPTLHSQSSATSHVKNSRQKKIFSASLFSYPCTVLGLWPHIQYHL
jgi:hypothetical protein